MKIAEALALRGAPESYERQESAWLLEHLLAVDVRQLKYKADAELSPEQEDAFLIGIRRLDAGEPLAYITGSQPFWTLDLKVTTDTLVPRPDTEILVETALQLPLPPHAKVLDLGTGTGAIALAIASERPKWQMTATDVYAPTLQVARENAEKYDLDVEFKLGSWFEALDAGQHFDLLVSNPPYIDAQDQHMASLGAEPRRALVADDQGLADYKTIIKDAHLYLADQAWLIFEHGYDQGEALRLMLDSAGYQQIKTVKDYGGNDRITLGCFNRI